MLLTLIFCLAGSMVSYAGTWIQDSIGWKYRDDDGSMLKDTFIQVHPNECVYYLDSNGYMVTGIVTIEGKKFCFSKDGVLQSNGKTSDGHLVDAAGQVIDDVNDGYTLIMTSMTENKVGNSRLIVVSLKNECNKPFTIRPTCGILREGERKTLYLYNTETRTFCDERKINPNETVSICYVDSDISEFYVDENSRLELYFIFDNEDFSCSTKIGEAKRGHFSADDINSLKSQE